MTDKEIIKALKCCIKSTHFGECFENKCPMASEKGCKVGKETLYPYALDLINRQQAEIERLRSMNQAKLDMIHDLRAEVEKLTVNMNALGLGMKREKERADTAIKEFAERVKDIIDEPLQIEGRIIDRMLDKIDTLVKEMTEKCENNPPNTTEKCDDRKTN